ncbi:uncharacterized protein LOC126979455 [Leptidea sinapis]|uniref:uncharacterized protein LOC126979455 n=1 Tax=Leptidea sinapis TaxID=189913 RepID=UPI00212C76FF|nr:uncharacterized protein LOC126979455 [Leptidea sinapis]
MSKRKQIKITKAFKKATTAIKPQEPEEIDELQQEIEKLKEEVKLKKGLLFQYQRQANKSNAAALNLVEKYVRPKKIITTNSVASLENELELHCMLNGVEVQSFVKDDHCCVVYHIQHNMRHHQYKHGLRIDMSPSGKEITKMSLPEGFKLQAVLKDYDNIMHPDCLGAIRKALVAYYDRLEQYEGLKKQIELDANLFKTKDTTDVEITFAIRSHMDEPDKQIRVTLNLAYGIYDILPNNYSFIGAVSDVGEDVLETLESQCLLLNKKRLDVAFHNTFIDGVGPYNMIQQMPLEQAPLNHRPKKHNNSNDNTFLPEACSDQGEEEYM